MFFKYFRHPKTISTHLILLYLPDFRRLPRQVLGRILLLDLGQHVLRLAREVSRHCSGNLGAAVPVPRLVAHLCRILDVPPHPGQHLPQEEELEREEVRFYVRLDRSDACSNDAKIGLNSVSSPNYNTKS